MQFEGGRKDVSSVAVLTDLENIRIKQKQREERIRRPDSVWLFKWKEVNRILEVYFSLSLSVVFLSSFKINKIARIGFFSRSVGTGGRDPWEQGCLTNRSQQVALQGSYFNWLQSYFWITSILGPLLFLAYIVYHVPQCIQHDSKIAIRLQII